MDENRNKRPRPRRHIESAGTPVPPAAKPTEAKPAAERPASSRPRAARVPAAPQKPAASSAAPARKPQPQKAERDGEVRETPKASPAPKSKPAPVAAQNTPSAPENENEQTRLSSVIPKAKLKTPVRVEKVKEEGGNGILGGVFKAILYMTAVLVAGILLAYGIILVGNDVFAFVKSDAAVEVVIPENATVDDIADILGEKNIIAYPSLFRLYAKFQDVDGVDEEGNSVFIPGTYTISPMNNYMQLLLAFQKQYSRDTVWVTFPEGSTVEEMITILVDEHGIASREEFAYAINEYDYDMEFLKDVSGEGKYYRLEGYLFPDTYQFYTDSNAETVIYKMLDNFEKKLSYIGDDNCAKRLGELGMTLDEVVTLASMIEKEVKYAVDYDQVSSVFHNRLADTANFPRLDSDATTVYAITMETGKRPETLGAAELAFDSPYNTRAKRGLPPGAIANPGYEALYCAFYPAKTKYYYFVADNSGYNLYARTADGHNKNVAEVRKDAQ